MAKRKLKRFRIVKVCTSSDYYVVDAINEKAAIDLVEDGDSEHVTFISSINDMELFWRQQAR